MGRHEVSPAGWERDNELSESPVELSTRDNGAVSAAYNSRGTRPALAGNRAGAFMRIAINCGLDRVEFEVADDRLVPGPQPPAALADPAAAVRAALEQPFEFPALRRALTPDDHVAIVVDEQLPHLAELLVPLLEHIQSAGVAPEAITLLCAPSSSTQPWIDDLPDAFQDVHVEMSDPFERRRMAYLATTHKGKRL